MMTRSVADYDPFRYSHPMSPRMVKRADGRYKVSLSVTDESTGEQKRVYFYGKTQKEANAARDAARDRLKAGAPVRDDGRTVAEWSAHWRATSLKASSRRATTTAAYDSLLRVHVEPLRLGSIPLARLRPSDVEGWLIDRRETELSPASLQKIFLVLRMCLEGAVRDGLLARNVVALVKQPSIPRSEARHLTMPEVHTLLAAARESRYGPTLRIIAYLGLRKGEALALTWDDIDFEKRTLSVRGTLSRVNGKVVVNEPKTASGKRVLPMSDSVISLLRGQHALQEVDRDAAANVWHEGNYVFTTASGEPQDPRNVLRALSTAARHAGLPDDVNVHSLRHSAATAMIEGGVHMKAVSELLGHADVRITLATYTHTSDIVAADALSKLSDAIDG